ncbi:hypothetical protein ACOMCU_03415 [Lysinibacillus sp. UGB7]|uniref:hypothetical protein n=1 Tax=Lysinibacillus sp. UGB7 TaxID=3411039 RepID=UPI003B7D6B36
MFDNLVLLVVFFPRGVGGGLLTVTAGYSETSFSGGFAPLLVVEPIGLLFDNLVLLVVFFPREVSGGLLTVTAGYSETSFSGGCPIIGS